MQITLILSIFQIVSILVTCGATIWGLNKWRTESMWKRKFQIAEDTLSLFYECRYKIEIIRNPWINGYEGGSRKSNENESPKQKDLLNRAYVYTERYEKEKEPFIKLLSLKFRFMALFGKDAGAAFDGTTKILNKIFIAAHLLANRYWQDQGGEFSSDREFEKHLVDMHKYGDVIWSTSPNDEISIEFEGYIKLIEEYCQKIIINK